MTASHQPDSMTQLVGDMLDILAKRDRAALGFQMAENGCMEETHDSVKRRITGMWGFQTSAITLLEGSMSLHFEVGGVQYNLYDSIQFSVNGKGWSTDFRNIERDSAYDDEER